MLNHRVKMVCSNCVCNSVPDEKLVFELELALISSQPWVTAPKHLCMWSGGKWFCLVWMFVTVLPCVDVCNCSSLCGCL